MSHVARSIRTRPPQQIDRDELWHHLKCALGLFVVLMSSSLFAALVGRSMGEASIRLDMIITAVDAVIILGFVRHGSKDMLPLLDGRAFKLSALGLVIGAFAMMFVFMGSYFLVLEQFLGLKVTRMTDSYVASGTSVVTMFVLISVCPAVFEELAFRGVIMNRLGRVLSRGETLALQAALFSVLHLSPAIFVSHFVMGLIFGMLRLKTKSLFPGMLLHAMWNGWVLVHELYIA